MLAGSRNVTLLLFATLGLAFLAETGALMWEFWNSGWFTIATHDSHLFLFFPTLGLVALAAFYVPALAFTDMYWQHVPRGRARFAIGFVVLAALSWWIAATLNSSPFRPLWDIAPRILQADASEPPGCGPAPAQPCKRVALLQSLEAVREVSSTHLGLKEFIGQCESDPLIEQSDTAEPRRFCFASTPLTAKPAMSTIRECCTAQELVKNTILKLSGPADQRSVTSIVHAVVLPLKVFFLLMLAAISVLLALRYQGVARHYPRDIGRIDLGVVVGAGAMLFFPLMSQGFVQTADALYGTTQNAGFKPIVNAMTVAFAVWALLLLMFFYRRHDRDLEILGKMAGVMASSIAVFKYDLMIALVTRYLGSGAGIPTIAGLLILSAGSALLLLSPRAANFFASFSDTVDQAETAIRPAGD